MISYGESLKILKDIAKLYRSDLEEEVSIDKSIGRVLTEDIFAQENNPSFDNSAMDGFAVNTTATSILVNSWIPVKALIGAGDPALEIQKIEGAVEIMTGASIPSAYYDSVVRVEDVEVKTDPSGKKMIRLSVPPKLRDNIRIAGEDTKVGDKLLSKGQVISCQHLLVLATQGISRVKVKRKIEIGILSTGKEIVDYHSKELQFGQIRNSTGVYLESSLVSPLFKVSNYGIIQDEQGLYIERIKKIFENDIELLISTGAVSMGVYDFVKPALESIGAKVHFHKCAIRPGKPILFATVVYNQKVRFIFGVPGNPISTLVGLKFFIRPFLATLLDCETERPLLAVLASDTKKPDGLKCFFKAKVFSEGVETKVEPLKGQASFMVSPLLQSNAWVVFPEEGSLMKRGTQVEVFNL